MRREDDSEPLLTETIAALVNDFRQGSGIDARLEIHAQPKDIVVSHAIVKAFYRIVQEALTSIYKYAHATTVVVEIEIIPENLQLIVTDNECGFDQSHVSPAGFGLQGMQERVAALNGTFALETAPGWGCRIQIEVPLVVETTV